MEKRKDLIFLTNDDGFNAEGLKRLIKIAKTNSSNVLTVAPENNQSGKSHSLTINKFLKIKKINKNFYVFKGSPVDCVILGLKQFSFNGKKPKLLLSGINIGANMGQDLHYSGTFAGAREGMLNGIPSVAISIQKNGKDINWELPNFYMPKIINNILKNNLCKDNLININFPNLSVQDIAGIKVTRLGKRKPGIIIQKKNIRNMTYLKIPSERAQHYSAKPGEDEYELNKGFITLTFHSAQNITLNQKNPKEYDLIKSKIFE